MLLQSDASSRDSPDFATQASSMLLSLRQAAFSGVAVFTALMLVVLITAWHESAAAIKWEAELKQMRESTHEQQMRYVGVGEELDRKRLYYDLMDRLKDNPYAWFR
ncbi:hypothetical protein SH661x_000880 [Planctomicrobium sp. SH661]|uniref:hypothetical protein n=1 Tax=Planctomicrobium sp. SH661 TaxID=3448124 RepID=UPI003F5AF54C